jgi:hypothetical protein
MWPGRVKQAVSRLKRPRVYFDAAQDQTDFDKGWSRNGQLKPGTPEFTAGKQPHQQAMAEQLERDFDASCRALDAMAREYQTYLTVFGLLAAGAAFVAQKQTDFIHTPYILVLCVPLATVYILIRSHRTRFPKEKRPGPGTKASEVTNDYRLANARRAQILRREENREYARHQLALVWLLCGPQIFVAGLYMIVSGIIALFG